MRFARSLPLIAAATTWLMLSACGGEEPAAQVPLMVLASQPASHDGQMITTQGVVRYVEDPLHYWIEDEQLRRVGVEPDDMIAPHLGETVKVTGRFHYAPEEGRSLQLHQVEPLE
ncbi:MULTISPECIES: hypothetical protein [Ectothiorhodospira]|jgi:hypothetical protein|uniref:Glucose-inhibited division protein B n=1 Tax=Ectothiorhodospira marina TaxID=1396821 RepID=A0A1H7G5X6_9GAMM|nr:MULTISPECIES: hypothetical protein [Ectothiorhodospira]MCG5515568.1 glucose-inhibited division protein B [Ectothiorhodospira sp. 9100]MCG5518727.1 glucose-inhibited division protein B [Ectothiorhodospira sp. 9905]SEK32857.1 hypothetical protein SAMN05444515_101426 [Ectothiorhodospira marina]